jgi:DNA-binding transcriptional LysR family regulator
MELRQLRYFVTLAEELHFGRAATREHIVQSALSQQLQRLERELDVVLLDRTTHHVELTPAGSAFLIEARQILAQVERAAVAAQRAASSAPVLRVGVVDASYDSMPQILQEVQQQYPEVEVHQVEAGVPEQFRLLADGRLDPLGVLVPEAHPLAVAPEVPVTRLAAEPLLLAEDQRAPEFNQFVIELCRSVGFVPRLYRGTVESIRAAVDLVAQGRCALCVPASCVVAVPGIVWRQLVEPVSRYPWSVLWRAGDPSEHVRALVASARTLSQELGWLAPSSQATG